MKNKQVMGLICILIAVATWGFLPISTGYVEHIMNSYTITFYRLLFALPILIVLKFIFREKWHSFSWKALNNKLTLFLLLCCVLGIVITDITFAFAVKYCTPVTINVMFQLAPIWFLIGCLVFFKEKITKIQLLGIIIVFVTGLVYFLYGTNNSGMLKNIPSIYSLLGIGLMVVCTIAWSFFACSQKPLLDKNFSPVDILIFITFFGSFIMYPFTTPNQILLLNSFTILNLIITVLAFPLGFGFFTLSLKYWENYKTSVIMTGQPLITVLFVLLVHLLMPKWVGNIQLNIIGIICIITTLIGVVLSLTNKKICDQT